MKNLLNYIKDDIGISKALVHNYICRHSEFTIRLDDKVYLKKRNKLISHNRFEDYVEVYFNDEVVLKIVCFETRNSSSEIPQPKYGVISKTDNSIKIGTNQYDMFTYEDEVYLFCNFFYELACFKAMYNLIERTVCEKLGLPKPDLSYIYGYNSYGHSVTESDLQDTIILDNRLVELYSHLSEVEKKTK
jgi:hypothetical protein